MGDRKWQDAPSTPAEIQEESTQEATEKTVVVKPAGGESAADPTTKQDDGKRESLNIRIHLNLHAKVKLDLDAQLDGDIIIGLY